MTITQEDYNNIKRLQTITSYDNFYDLLTETNLSNISDMDYYSLLKQAATFAKTKAFELILEIKETDFFELSILELLYSFIGSNKKEEMNIANEIYFDKLLNKIDKELLYQNYIGKSNILVDLIEANNRHLLDILLNRNLDLNRFVNNNKALNHAVDQVAEYEFVKIFPLIDMSNDDLYYLALNVLKTFSGHTPITSRYVAAFSNKNIDIYTLKNKKGITTVDYLLNCNDCYKIESFKIEYLMKKDERDQHGNNIVHHYAYRGSFPSFGSLLMKDEDLIALMFEKNNYNLTPIDFLISKKENYNTNIMLYMLNIMMSSDDKNRPELEKIIEDNKEILEKITLDVEKIKTYATTEDLKSLVASFLSTYKDGKRANTSNYKMYDVYTKEKVEEYKKLVTEILGNDDKLIPWVKKLEETSGSKMLINNIQLKKNIGNLREIFPNFKEFIDHVENYIYLNDMGDGHFSIPPSLLVSSPGIGKTFFLSSLSKAVGVTYDMINMESVSAGFALIGGNAQWANGNPGLVFQNLFKSEYANSILILDEIDKTPKGSYPVDSALLPLLETHTAIKFRDEFIQIPLDIRKAVWVATANDSNNISAPIKSRFQIFNIPNPTFAERKILIGAIYKALIADNSWGDKFEKEVSDEVQNELASDSNSSRDLRKALLKAFGKAAKRNDTKILSSDLDIKDNTKITEPWDIRKEGN